MASVLAFSKDWRTAGPEVPSECIVLTETNEEKADMQFSSLGQVIGDADVSEFSRLVVL